MKRIEPRLWWSFAAILVTGVGLAFYVPGLRKTGGHFPVPLDDVYIHFGFARSAALGHPFAWIPGNGYSSGGTSLTYPLLLAPAWLLGMRGERLAIAAALLAVGCLIDLAISVRRLVHDGPRWVTWAAPALLLAVPLLDWSLYSGMETALFAALAGRALVAVDRAASAPPGQRARAQLVAGLYGALVVATRPETAPFAFLLGIAAAHAARSLPLGRSLARAVGPLVGFLGLQAAANRVFTGEWSAAGAVRKLIGSSPYPSSLEVAGEVIKNLVALREQALGVALGGPVASALLLGLGLAGLTDRRARRLSIPLLLGAYASLLLVSLNSTARFQNLRYAAPTILFLLLAAALGVASIARKRPRVGSSLAAAALLAWPIAAPMGAFPAQIDHFARASANIAGQQVEVARRLAAREPRPRRVLVGDAGAIPYLSGLDALDGLGLGGYRGMPFARASVHGVPAVVELIERLPPDERPDVFALYPSWWGGLADVFGKRAFGVKIEDNVICAADEKVVYDADYTALAPPGEERAGAVDAVDVADLVDERAHDLAFSRPHGGWVIGAVLALPDGRPRFDAGRIIPEGKEISFEVQRNVSPGPARLVLRTDGGGPLAIAARAGAREAVEATSGDRPGERWSEIGLDLPEIRGGERIVIEARKGALRVFSVWLVRDEGAIRNPSRAPRAPRPGG
ncbi:MAG: hypothetical protein U0359_20050 [Byssovorax sp.]